MLVKADNLCFNVLNNGYNEELCEPVSHLKNFSRYNIKMRGIRPAF